MVPPCAGNILHICRVRPGIIKILIENLIPVRWDSIRKDLYFSFQKRRSNFSFYISLYYIEVLISQHTWPCIVNCYWSAEKQHKGSANRKKNKVCRCTGKYRLPFLTTTFPPPHTPHHLAPSLLPGNSVMVVQL